MQRSQDILKGTHSINSKEHDLAKALFQSIHKYDESMVDAVNSFLLHWIDNYIDRSNWQAVLNIRHLYFKKIVLRNVTCVPKIIFKNGIIEPKFTKIDITMTRENIFNINSLQTSLE